MTHKLMASPDPRLGVLCLVLTSSLPESRWEGERYRLHLWTITMGFDITALDRLFFFEHKILYHGWVTVAIIIMFCWVSLQSPKTHIGAISISSARLHCINLLCYWHSKYYLSPLPYTIPFLLQHLCGNFLFVSLSFPLILVCLSFLSGSRWRVTRCPPPAVKRLNVLCP